MGLQHLDLHVPTSDDGRTTFSEIADVLDHLATVYAWHPDVHSFLLVHANTARQVDRVYKENDDLVSLTVV